MLANPVVQPFLSRTGTQWLEQLRTIRLIAPIKKKPSSKKKEDKFMSEILSKLTPAQMQGYLRGLNK